MTDSWMFQPAPYRELLLGCGHRRNRIIDPYPHYAQQSHKLQPARLLPESERWKNVVTVDINPGCDPDLLLDLSGPLWIMGPDAVRRRPSPDVLVEIEGGDLAIASDSFDEIHAYEVLEHLGRLGDYETYFAQFDELWRMLKPGGFLCATVPSRYDIWAWGDPGHTRMINQASLIFLHRPHYDAAVGNGPSSDYRSVFSADFDIVQAHDNEVSLSFVLQAVKPVRKGKTE